MTKQQKSARSTWRKARKDYREAPKGFRARTRKALELAALNILKADIAARHDGLGVTDGGRRAA